MRKEEFLAALRTALGKLPEQEILASLDFYAEMIDDRMEDGATEEEAVAALGDVDSIAAQITAEVPPIPKAVAKMKTSSRTANIVLAIVLSPIWIPLAFAFALCVAAIYLSLWAVIIGLWLCVACLILCGPVGIAGLIYCLGTGFPLTGAWTVGCGLAACGLGLFALVGVKAVSNGLIQLTSMFASKVKSLFVRKVREADLKEKAVEAGGAAKEKAVAAASYVKGRAASATESARAAIHEATAPKSNPTNAAPVPPPGYVMAQDGNPSSTSQDSTESAPCEQLEPAAASARPEGDNHDHRA